MTEMLLAAPERPDPNTWVGPGLLGLVVILGIALAMVLLWRNMNKQLGKIDVGNGSESNGSDGTGHGSDGTGHEFDVDGHEGNGDEVREPQEPRPTADQ